MMLMISRAHSFRVSITLHGCSLLWLGSCLLQVLLAVGPN